jgi:hypothetical protein
VPIPRFRNIHKQETNFLRGNCVLTEAGYSQIRMDSYKIKRQSQKDPGPWQRVLR